MRLRKMNLQEENQNARSILLNVVEQITYLLKEKYSGILAY